MAKSQSNLKIINLESSDEDESECESNSSKSHDRESPEAGSLSQTEEILYGRLEWEPQFKIATKACRTPEGEGEGEREQSHPITLPPKNLVTPAAVSRPWGKSSEQPQAIVKPFHKEKSEEFDTWKDEHSRRKQDQRPKSHKGNYHFQRDKGQISKATHCTFEVHFDKGQTRCYWNNPSLIIKVTNLQSEYLKDARESSDAHFNIQEVLDCLKIEIVGEDSIARKYSEQLKQLRQEMWKCNFDLHRIVQQESDVALMAHGLENNFITMAEKSLHCGILVEKSSRRIRHFLSSSSHWVDDQPAPKPEIVRSTDHSSQESPDKLTIRNSTIHVVNADITKYKAKCLVNFFDKKSGLSTRGVVFNNFRKRGRDQFLEALKSNYSGTENVVVTESSGNLHCQYICHVALSNYHGESSLQELRQIVQECFNWCSTLELYDVAFPFLGVGKMLSYPAEKVARILISESISRVEEGCDWKISFVLFERENYNMFTQQLGFHKPRFHTGRGFGGHVTSHSEPDLRVKPYSPQYGQRDRRVDPRRGSATSEVSVPDIYLYTISREEGRNVRQEFANRIKEEYCHEQVFENVEIKDLSMDKKKKMYTAGQNHEVSVFLDKDKNRVILKGKAKNVSTTAREIASLCSSESATKSVAKRRENHYQRGTQQYWNELLKEPSVPTYWKYFQDGKSFLDVVKSFFTTTFKHYDVDPKTFHAVRKLVEETFDSRLVGQGVDAKNLTHGRLRVKKVELIENLDLFKDYNTNRIRILNKCLTDKRGFPPKIEKIPSQHGTKTVVEKGRIFTEKKIDPRLMKDIYPELNEVYLFHGTKGDFVKNIMSKGIDPKYGSDDGMFGRGIYCCETSTKADQYADDKNKRGKEGRMFLMRLLLGHVYVTENPKKFKQPPCAHCREDTCSNHSHWPYDSVVGVKKQSGGLFREFVVYERNQCYPEYLITYTRL